MPVVQAAESGVVVGPFVVAALLLLVPAVCALWCAKDTRVGVGVAVVHEAGAFVGVSA